jgi:hypothetical protein
MTTTSPSVVEVLRSTLKRIETTEELASDDPALTGLKESVLSKIIELEVAKTPKPQGAPHRILWISPKVRPEAQADMERQGPEAGSQSGASYRTAFDSSEEERQIPSFHRRKVC